MLEEIENVIKYDRIFGYPFPSLEMRYNQIISVIGQLKKTKETMETNIGKKVIIRGDRSGVEFGTLVAQNGREVTLHNARRLWYWNGAASLSQLAKDGTTIPRECKFTVTVDSITILDAIEIIPCTDKAIKSIEEVREWKR